MASIFPRPSSGLADRVSSIMGMLRGDPQSIAQQMMRTNPQFAEFVRRNQGKSLDQLRGKRSDQISAQDRRQLLKGSFEAWAKWEADAASTYAEAAKGLEECEVARHRVLKMQRSAEREMVEAKRALEEMSACGWDLIHAYEIGG